MREIWYKVPIILLSISCFCFAEEPVEQEERDDIEAVEIQDEVIEEDIDVITGLKIESSLEEIKLTWQSIEGEFKPAGYLIFRGRYLGFSTTQPINDELVGEELYIDKNIEPDKVYYYRVVAQDTSGNLSRTSDEVRVKTPSLALPSAPGGFEVKQEVQQIRIKWSESKKGTYAVKGYNIYRSEYKRIGYKILNKGILDNQKYIDRDIMVEKIYYYYVEAVDSEGNKGEPSERLSGFAFIPNQTGLVLMPTAYRNTMKDEVGANFDFVFSYYIGRLYGEHKLRESKVSDSMDRLGILMLSGDLKLAIHEEEKYFPQVALGYIFTYLSSDAPSPDPTFAEQAIPVEAEEESDTLSGFYLVGSKRLGNTSFHLGIVHDELVNYISYTSEYLNSYGTSENMLFAGVSIEAIPRMPIKIEFLLPISAFQSPYIINTHLGQYFSLAFDISYLHYNKGWAPEGRYSGGYDILGFFSVRLPFYPTPGKDHSKKESSLDRYYR